MADTQISRLKPLKFYKFIYSTKSDIKLNRKYIKEKSALKPKQGQKTYVSGGNSPEDEDGPAEI